MTRRITSFTVTRRAFTIVEALVAVTILAVLLTLAVPRMRQASEQMRLDAAALRLKSIWSAQRVHWLEHGSFAISVEALMNEGLLDNLIGAGNDGSWNFAIGSMSEGNFVATATRESGGWDGTIEIDETGELTGGLKSPGGPYLRATPQ